MRIAALSLKENGAWPAVELNSVDNKVSVVYGPAGSGKTTVAEFLAHALYGQPPAAGPSGAARLAPEGEAIVETSEVRYRLRRYSSAAGNRLTVSALDGTAVDHESVRRMLGGLPPLLLRRLCSISFQQQPQLDWLLCAEFAREFRALGVAAPGDGNRRTAELLARRDTLAKELETRLAGEGRASRELDTRRRELDRLIGETEREMAAVDQRFRSVEAALTETDTRLRYRRLEMNVDRGWQAPDVPDWEVRLAELDAEITRSRKALADLASREATVRSRLAQLHSSAGAADATAIEQRAWLAVGRQLAADLSGEVARQARASASEQCVCRDSHPRLRPIVETIQRQLEVLGTLVDEHERAVAAGDLEKEIDCLTRSQAELGRQLGHLLEQRQSLSRRVTPGRRLIGVLARRR